MKKWHILTATAMALVLTVSVPLAAFAQRADEANAAKPPLHGSLAIVAPRQVVVGIEVSLGVFQRENQEPVPGAGVWALTRDHAESLKKDALIDRIANAEDAENESILNGRGTFLGRTGGDGRLSHTFTATGNYVLLAAKKGYVPDFAPLVVKGPPVDALTVNAPRVSPPGESVTIKVTEKSSGEAVKDAGVWALSRENAEKVKGQIAAARPTANASADGDSILNAHGTFLGRTNGNGEIKHTFEDEGTFVLVAYKKGYTPGLSVIAIKDIPKALAIQAPRSAPVGETVTIKVNQRGTGEGVKDAGVWALTPAEAEALKAANATAANAESVIEGHGIFIGRTNGNGEVKHKFETAGRYVIVAVKNGYIPGYTGIAIIPPDTKPSVRPNTAAGLKPGAVRSANPANAQ